MKQQRSQFRAIRGVRDILPPESALWNRVEQTASAVFATYNFQEIRLPIFEPTELFARSVGLDTDIVSKEMYSFEDYEPSEVVQLRAVVADFPYSESTDPAARVFRDILAKFIQACQEAFNTSGLPK